MEKYSFEFKKQIVQEYLEGKGGYTYLSNKYGLSTSTLLKYWVKAYREMATKDCYDHGKSKNTLSNSSFMW